MVTYSDLYHPSLKCNISSIFIIFLGVGGFSDYISGGCEASSQTTIISSGRYTNKVFEIACFSRVECRVSKLAVAESVKVMDIVCLCTVIIRILLASSTVTNVH